MYSFSILEYCSISFIVLKNTFYVIDYSKLKVGFGGTHNARITI